MASSRSRRFWALLPLILLGCLDPYEPFIEFSPTDVLVIDGLLDPAAQTATVKLSRPQAIASKEPLPQVTGATVSVSSPSTNFTLKETFPGNYTLTGIPVTIGEKYTLRVKTNDGREFYSDAMIARGTPPLDSITFQPSNDGKSMDVMVNSHDVTNEAKYFSWDYVETYEYMAQQFSGYIWHPTTPRQRRDNELVYRCWRTIPSSSIGIVTTRDLSGSVVNKFPIISIPGGSLKLSNRYSVLVKQRVISQEEYVYLGMLKKTTESLGGLFDPQPATVRGNLHEVDRPGNVVLGYFSASAVSLKRVFITYEELPESFQIPQPRTCEVKLTCPVPSNTGFDCTPLEVVGYNHELLYAETTGGGATGRYAYTDRECSDCRTHGGVTKRPDFW